MHQGIRYTLLFVAVVLLQSLVFNQVQISIWFNPLVYIAFVRLLPMRTMPIVVLTCGALMGVSMDVIMGLAGVNTIASLATAYLRPLILRPIVGKDAFVDGGVPAPMQIGLGKFVLYASLFTLVQCAIFFALEAMTIDYAMLIVGKVLLNTAVSMILTVLIASVFAPKNYNN